MTISRGAIAPGKRQTHWKIEPEILAWLAEEVRQNGFSSLPAAVNFWLTRLRKGSVFLKNGVQPVPPPAGRRKRAKQTVWRIWEDNCLWLEEQGSVLGLKTMTATANFWLARCMNGEVFIQE